MKDSSGISFNAELFHVTVPSLMSEQVEHLIGISQEPCWAIHGDPGPWPWKMLDLLEVSDDGLVMVRHLKFTFLVRFQQQAQRLVQEKPTYLPGVHRRRHGVPHPHITAIVCRWNLFICLFSFLLYFSLGQLSLLLAAFWS